MNNQISTTTNYQTLTPEELGQGFVKGIVIAYGCMEEMARRCKGSPDEFKQWYDKYKSDAFELTAEYRKKIEAVLVEVNPGITVRKIAKTINEPKSTVIDDMADRNRSKPETPTSKQTSKDAGKVNQIKKEYISFGYGSARKHITLNTEDAKLLRGNSARDVGMKIPNDEIGMELKENMVNKFEKTKKGLRAAEDYINARIQKDQPKPAMEKLLEMERQESLDRKKKLPLDASAQAVVDMLTRPADGTESAKLDFEGIIKTFIKSIDGMFDIPDVQLDKARCILQLLQVRQYCDKIKIRLEE